MIEVIDCVDRGTRFCGDQATVPNLNLRAGHEVIGHVHSYPHVMLCVAGEVEVRLGDERTTLRQWQECNVPAGVKHSAVALTDGAGFLCLWRRDLAEMEGV